MWRCLIAVALVLGLSLVLCACSQDPVNPPDQPNLAPLVEAFDSPTGTLNPETAEALARDFASLLDETELFEAIVSQLDGATLGFEGKDDGMSQSALTESGYAQRTYPQVDASAKGWIELTYVCGPAESLPEGQGRIILNMIGEVGTVQTLIWGRFESCLLATANDETRLTGDVAFLPSVSNDGQGTVFSLELLVSRNGTESTISLETRVKGEVVELLRTVEKQSFVVIGPDRNLNRLGIRDARGEWTCDLETQGCQGPVNLGDFQW